MPGFATIKLTPQTLGSVMSSLSDTPGAQAKFMYACLIYDYNGEDVYFVRGNYKNKPGLHGFEDHLFTKTQLNEVFDWTSSDGVRRRHASIPSGEWFVVYFKGSHLIDTLLDKDGQIIVRRTRGELQAFLKKGGGYYLNCSVQVSGSDTTISVKKYKGEFNGEEADKAIAGKSSSVS